MVKGKSLYLNRNTQFKNTDNCSIGIINREDYTRHKT